MMVKARWWIFGLCLSALLGCGGESGGEVNTTGESQASEATRAANQLVAEHLDLDQQQDFIDANRGLVARQADLWVKDLEGRTIWRPSDYDFVQGPAPATVNPSLWRQAKLNNLHGLYKVTEGIYQLRGYDLSNMTLIKADKGWIVVDPLTSRETAAAAISFARQQLGELNITGVILTHSHVDHFGGVLSVVEAGEDIPIVAPENFLEEALSLIHI